MKSFATLFILQSMFADLHPAAGEYWSPPLGGDQERSITIKRFTPLSICFFVRSTLMWKLHMEILIMAGYVPFGASLSAAKHPHILGPANFHED